ncbi:MAG: L,D-transpeptidase family protein [Candidatus Paceibacterota bacterium]
MNKISRKTILFLLALLVAILAVSLVTAPDESKEASFISHIIAPLQKEIPILQKKQLFEYVEIIDSCGPYFTGTCVNVRKEPSSTSEAVTKLRNGIVLKVENKVVTNGETWYKVTFDEWLRYPERVTGDWYVSSTYAKLFLDEGPQELLENVVSTSSKHIIVDRSSQKLYAYDGDVLFMEEPVSTGIEGSLTPRGIFNIYRKTPSRYMQGPLIGISEKYYDLPGVPWNLYFTEDGAVIHGAYWHDHFGKRWSSGCVNMSPEKAKELYEWADVGIKVTVQD